MEDSPGGGGMPAPPDPYTAMCMYYSKLSAFRPWSPKAGFPPFQGYPLHPPYSRATPSEVGQEGRRVEDGSPSSGERYHSESPQVNNTVKRKAPAEKGDQLYRIKGRIIFLFFFRGRSLPHSGRGNFYGGRSSDRSPCSC